MWIGPEDRDGRWRTTGARLEYSVAWCAIRTPNGNVDGDRPSPPDAGRSVTLYFCATCGVAVYFISELRSNLIGVHGGCFADPEFPAPNVVLWTECKHHWLTLPDVEHTFEQQAP